MKALRVDHAEPLDAEGGVRREKSPRAFRTISEVAELLDTPAHVLRFWETKFPHLKPMKRGGGRRYYRPEDVALLRGVRELLYEEGLTIKGVQKVLREKGPRHVILVGEGDDEPVASAPAPAAETVARDAPAPRMTHDALGSGAPASRGRVTDTISRLESLREQLRRG